VEVLLRSMDASSQLLTGPRQVQNAASASFPVASLSHAHHQLFLAAATRSDNQLTSRGWGRRRSRWQGWRTTAGDKRRRKRPRVLRVGELLLYLLLKLLNLMLQLLLLLHDLLDTLLQLLMLLLVRSCRLLGENSLLQLLKLCHILLKGGQLLLVGDGILLQGSQSLLVLLLELALLKNLLLQLLV
jgi:hypothetical protein